MVSEELLRILVCPFCKSDIRLEGNMLVSECGLRFSIVDDIPQMVAPACPNCGTEMTITKEAEKRIEFKCERCGKTLWDKTLH